MHIERSKNIFISILIIVVEFPIFQFHVNVIPFFRFYLFLQNFLLPLLDCQWFRIKLSVPSLPPFFRYSLSSLYPSSLPFSLLIPSLKISQLIFDRINRVILPLKALNTALKHRYSYIDTKRKKYETIDLMFHRTYDSFFLSSWQLIFAISMCLRFVYGWNSEETLEKTIYIYIFISRIQWRTRSIFKDKPSFATVDRNLQSLAFHAWNFIFSRVYASAIYIYISIFSLARKIRAME